MCIRDRHEGLDKQIRKADSSLESNPDDRVELFNRATLHFHHRDYDKALVDVVRLESLTPIHPKCYLLKARVLMAIEKNEAAKVSLEKFFQITPESIDGYLLRCKLNDLTGEGGNAIADARMAIQLAKKRPLSSYLNLIAMERKYGTKASAAATFMEVKQVIGATPTLLGIEAEWLADTGELEKAAIVYAEIREKNPTLSFTIFLDEAIMWSEYANYKRAHEAKIEAKEAWERLSPKIRQRKAMVEKYNALIESLKKQ